MTIYEGNVPEKCEASTNFECQNADKTLEELGVFYESVLPKQEETSRICESCHNIHGLGKLKDKCPLGQRFELQENGDWKLIEVEMDPGVFEEMWKYVNDEFIPKIKKVASYIPFAETAVACYYCAIDSQTPLSAKIGLIGALVYFISPLDLIPDIIPIAGYLDDAAVIYGVVKIFDSNLKEEHWTAAKHFWDEEPVEGCDCPYCASF